MRRPKHGQDDSPWFFDAGIGPEGIPPSKQPKPPLTWTEVGYTVGILLTLGLLVALIATMARDEGPNYSVHKCCNYGPGCETRKCSKYATREECCAP